MNQQERTVLSICFMAALADGINDESEQAEIRRIAATFKDAGDVEVRELYHDVLLKRRSLAELAGDLPDQDMRRSIFEMAVGVCNADGAQSEPENRFLDELRAALSLDAESTKEYEKDVKAMAEAPIESSPVGVIPPQSANETVQGSPLDTTILNYSILIGALEILPQSLATMAILPLQMKMVYQIGKAFNYELDRGHIKDFAATLGIGLTGQYIEQMGRKLFGGLLRSVGGGLLGGLGSAAVGSSVSFATTYALGNVAKQYYAGGRKIDSNQLKAVFASMLEKGKGLQSLHMSDIQQKAKTIDMKQIVGLVKSS